jgi:hypothetical protein
MRLRCEVPTTGREGRLAGAYRALRHRTPMHPPSFVLHAPRHFRVELEVFARQGIAPSRGTAAPERTRSRRSAHRKRSDSTHARDRVDAPVSITPLLRASWR